MKQASHISEATLVSVAAMHILTSPLTGYDSKPEPPN